MVSSVGSIGSFAADILKQYQEMMSASESVKTGNSQSFSELVGNGAISGTQNSSSTGITAMGGASESSESSSSSSSNANSEMDLNNDGQVTADEVIRYMQIQMMDEMTEQASSEDGSAQMNQQSQAATGIEDFKNQQAAKAYQNSQKLLSSLTDMIAGSFLA